MMWICQERLGKADGFPLATFFSRRMTFQAYGAFRPSSKTWGSIGVVQSSVLHLAVLGWFGSYLGRTHSVGVGVGMFRSTHVTVCPLSAFIGTCWLID